MTNCSVQQPPDVVESPLQGVQLQGLELVLGSELRFQVPLMVNLAISGSIEVSGGLDPGSLVPSGTIQIDGGMVNLLATQLRMARADQPGRITFVPEQVFLFVVNKTCFEPSPWKLYGDTLQKF